MEEINYSQKGCHNEARGTDDPLYINQHILKKSKTRRKHIATAWIDYKKDDEIVLQSCLKYIRYPTKS